ncbi:MAG: cysteine desulfurase NifS [Candidatus Aenigmatarchaeota archaeon]|nr:MAG: cysteine desulfurase NifS [Candidatus Aenigmarchaeota archaeon]
MMKAYFDYAATSPPDPRVLKAMMPFFRQKFGNPSSIHSWGREAKTALDLARERVSRLLGAEAEEIIFTSGGTEANNLAIQGIAWRQGKGHIVTSRIEHHSVLRTCQFLEKQGFKVTYLPVGREGRVSPEAVQEAIRKDTILVSIMWVNNEIGAIQPIKEIAKICQDYRIPFHTDAVQGFGKLEINVKKLGISLLSASSHKIYGPKGVGCLYKAEDVELRPMLYGGHHERKIRAGTENVPGIVGFGEACRIAGKEMKRDEEKARGLRKRILKACLSIPDSWLNGDLNGLPSIANFGFRGIEGEALVLKLDLAGIAASTGSACAEKELEPSHVLLALGLSPMEAHGSLRLSWGRFTEQEEVDYLLEVLPEKIEELRRISPV